MGNLINLTGQKFGRLTVIKRSDRRGSNAFWDCACECGNTNTIASRSLTNGLTKSCGCRAKDTCFKPKHNKSHSLEYHSWMAMRKRAYNRDGRFPQYENRGIEPEWDLSFESFYADLGPIPSDKHSLDRIDNDKGYYRGNCRWATSTQQNRNYSQNVFIDIDGKKMCVTDWAEYIGVDRHQIYRKIKRGQDKEMIIRQLLERSLLAQNKPLADQDDCNHHSHAASLP